LNELGHVRVLVPLAREPFLRRRPSPQSHLSCSVSSALDRLKASSSRTAPSVGGRCTWG